MLCPESVTPAAENERRQTMSSFMHLRLVFTKDKNYLIVKKVYRHSSMNNVCYRQGLGPLHTWQSLWI